MQSNASGFCLKRPYVFERIMQSALFVCLHVCRKEEVPVQSFARRLHRHFRFMSFPLRLWAEFDGSLSDDCHFLDQMTCSCILVDDEERVADVYHGSALQLGIVGNVTRQSFVVAVESGTDQFTPGIEDR